MRWTTTLYLTLSMQAFGAAAPERAGAQDRVIRDWSVSGAYAAERVQREAYPGFYAIFLAEWQPLQAGEGGGVDVTGRFSPEDPGGDLVLARHVFHSPEDRVMRLEVGYAHEADLFFNGWPVFSGRAGPRPPDAPPSAMAAPYEEGVAEVQVRRGLNEIFLMVTRGSRGWGFTVRADGPLQPKPVTGGVAREVWATTDTFLTPESVLKDPLREVLYVSSFDNQFASKPQPTGYISRLGMDGEILDHAWVEGLHAPTGMDVWRDTLWVAERESLLAIDIPSGTVAGRWPIPDPVFPNDLVIDDEGTIYISDTRTGDWPESRIYRFRHRTFDVFANEGISRANGLWIHDGDLIVGSSGDGLLKRVDLETGRVRTVLSLGWGLIDGIRVDSSGNILVSHWEGQLYRITPAGEITQILDAMPEGWNVADFEYLPDEGLLLVPTFLDNRVRAVRITR